MKDVLMIAHFIRGTIEGRFEYLANKLANEGYAVELVTTEFSHELKRKRKKEEKQLKEFQFYLNMLPEPGYKKNISVNRFYSHYVMGQSLKKYLKNRKKPDIIYCGVPSLDVAKVAAEYARIHNIKFIIDVQDLWPEAFKMVFQVPIISDLIFYPMKRKADYIYSTADEIIAVSKTYANRAIKVNNKCKVAHDVFLGIELTHFDKLAELNKFLKKPKGEIWIAYIGTLGHSYDLTCVIDALKILKDKGYKNIKFVVMGDGPLKSKFEGYAIEKGIYSEFTGRLNYSNMVGLLTACDIAVNPIKAGSAGSIINKVGDYSAAGLPVLNTQESKEYRQLIEEYNIGLNCKNNNADDFADNLLKMCEDDNLRIIMGQNSRRLAEEKFDRNKTYQEILTKISGERGERK
ncbi:glycosyltransferase family 4 protein [Peribacillus sp. NPDC060253]|uniref:glycosyltransferase family 4 protein n=1 Tax=Peribacillus sp. NPDC060253 TaxID=3347084 RepID=UPI003660192B